MATSEQRSKEILELEINLLKNNVRLLQEQLQKAYKRIGEILNEQHAHNNN
jgi:chaperonin cofactor prefoldin